MNRMIRTWAEIRLDAIEHNYRAITAQLPAGCQMLGVCKANAYGHGAVRVAQRLQEAGCRWVAVNCYDEVEELRAAGVQTEILMLSPQPANIALDIVDLDATQAVGSLEYAENLNRYLMGTDLRLKVHMKLETGMGRTGFDATNPACRADMLRALRWSTSTSRACSRTSPSRTSRSRRRSPGGSTAASRRRSRISSARAASALPSATAPTPARS